MLIKRLQMEQQTFHVGSVAGSENLNWADLAYMYQFWTSVIQHSGHDKEL
jgi:hypothetical protein